MCVVGVVADDVCGGVVAEFGVQCYVVGAGTAVAVVVVVGGVVEGSHGPFI